MRFRFRKIRQGEDAHVV